MFWDNLFKKKENFATTAIGYVNKNKQKNLGRTSEKGTDKNQWLYRMRCEYCKAEYTCNGSDIHLKKCPVCQRGKDTGK